MKIKLFGIGALLLLAMHGKAQLQWPAISQQNKPWARWWWEGSAVDKKNITANLQDYKNAGLGGLEITPIYGVQGKEAQFINFLSPKWMNMLTYTLKEAKRLGLGIDIANGTGWPFGGPWIKDKDASKTVVYKLYNVKGGEQLQEPVLYEQEGFVRTANTRQVKADTLNKNIAANKNLQALALDQVKFSGRLPVKLVMAYSNTDTINLTDKVDANGKLHWTAPAGNWKVYALFESLHGKMVERAAPGGEGYAIDHFSAEALQTFLSKFDDAFKGHDISYIRALFNDSYEVDDANGQSNWTPKLFEEFKKRRGYDLRNYLPALFKQADEETNKRVIYDYRSTIDELILEYFTQAWKKWGATKGALIRNQSHGSPANLLDLYGAIDIPETEGHDILRFKFATSSANVTGKPLVSSESATWLNEHFLSSWGDVKKVLDLFFLGGVNHAFYHGVNYSPKDEVWPGWLFYAAVHFNQANPQWNHFPALNDYVAKTQSFLQQGKPNNDLLLFYPLVDRYMDPGKNLLQHFDNMEHEFNGTDFQKTSEWMLKNGYTFDFFSDRQLQNFTATASTITTSGGNQYHTILLPANNYISDKSFKKLMELATAGANVLVYKTLPQDVPGLHDYDKRKAAFYEMLQTLKFAKSGPVNKAVIGKGAFYVSDDLNELMLAGGLLKESLVNVGLQFVRRKNTDGYTYFINNRTEKAIDEYVVLNKKAASVALFNAINGSKGLAETEPLTKAAFVKLRLQLAPHESVIVRTYNTKKEGSRYPYVTAQGDAIKLNGEWKVSFTNGGPVLPAPYTTRKLASWTEQDNDVYKNFSGSARYVTSFTIPRNKATKYLLQLGKVHETAQVFLNGKKLATLIGPEFSTTIPATALQNTNRLEVVVSNLMANRIRYMDMNGMPWKKFYNINMSARKRENLKNGVFDASAWDPQPSGLQGPVSLIPLQ